MKRPGGFDRSGAGEPDPQPIRLEPEGPQPARPESAGTVGASLRDEAAADPGRAAPVIAFPGGRVSEVETAQVHGGDTGETAVIEPVESLAPVESHEPPESAAPRGRVASVEPVGVMRRLQEAAPVREAKRRLRRASRSRRSQESRDRRRFTAHARRRRRTWAIGGLAVVLLALFVAVGTVTPLTAVREVEISGVSRVNEQDMRAALARFDGVPLALVSEQEVHRALEPFPLIQRYAIERIPPHTLRVRIEERDPVIALERDGQLGLVDPAGVLVATSAERPEGIPLGSGTVIDTASPAFHAAATVIRDMPGDLRAQLASVTASSPQDVEFTLTGGTRVIWGEGELTQRKSVVLRAILASVGPVALIDVAAPDTPVFRQ